MSILPASRLTAADLARLGNNLRPPARPRAPRPGGRSALAAVNRSLARHGQCVRRLERRPNVPAPAVA